MKLLFDAPSVALYNGVGNEVNLRTRASTIAEKRGIMFFRRASWFHYLITLVIFIAVWFHAPIALMVDEPNATFSFVAILCTVFGNALALSLRDAYMKWMYPVLTVSFAWMFTDFVYSHIHHNNSYLFGRRIVNFQFFDFVFIVLLANILGFAAGLVLRNAIAKEIREKTCKEK